MFQHYPDVRTCLIRNNKYNKHVIKKIINNNRCGSAVEFRTLAGVFRDRWREHIVLEVPTFIGGLHALGWVELTTAAASPVGGGDTLVGTAQDGSWLTTPLVGWERGKIGRNMDRRNGVWDLMKRGGWRLGAFSLTTRGYGGRWRRLRSRWAPRVRDPRWGS